MEADDVRVKLCQQHVIKLDIEITALIEDIKKCEGPLADLNELNKVVTGKLQEFKTRLEGIVELTKESMQMMESKNEGKKMKESRELQRFANEQDKETDKIKLLKEVDTYRKQLNSTQARLRVANLTCQLTIEKNGNAQLFGGGTKLRQRGNATKEAMMSTASSVTENLMSLSRMMADEVQQSEQTMNTLVSSSKVVGETHEELKNMGGHIHSSHKLLTKYGRRECTDKLLIILALAFFFATVLYVVKKRLFDRWTVVDRS